MREMLFRGKLLVSEEWVEGFYCEFANNRSGEQEYFIQTVKPDGRIDILHKVDPSTVSQYTGLKDKNGKRIFEGDIVAFEDAVADYEGYHDNVFVNHGAVSISPYGGVSFSNRQTVEMDDLYDTDDSIDAEVIGNIHDNPELLKGGRGMIREEAIEYWENLRKTFSSQLEHEENHFGRMHLQTSIDAIDMAISALRQQEHFRDLTKKVEPLALDELRKMDGEPVWVQSPGVPEYGRWAIVEGVGENCLFLHDDFTCHDYGKTWLAYRNKKEV